MKLIIGLLLLTLTTTSFAWDQQLANIQNQLMWNQQRERHEGLLSRWRDNQLVTARCYSTNGSYATVEIPRKLLKASPNCVPFN